MEQQPENLPSSNEAPVAEKPNPRWRPHSSRGESCYTPKPGYISNPFYSGSIRNEKCSCGSGKKTKKCHGSSPFIRDPRMAYKTLGEQVQAPETVEAEDVTTV